MIENVELKWYGLNELEDAMSSLDSKTKDSVLKGINRSLAKRYVIDRLKQELPYSQETRDTMKIGSVKGDKTGVIAGGTGYPLTFVEYGTVEREGRGMIAPQNQIGPILDAAIEPLATEWARELGDSIMAQIEKKIKAGERKLNKLG